MVTAHDGNPANRAAGAQAMAAPCHRSARTAAAQNRYQR